MVEKSKMQGNEDRVEKSPVLSGKGNDETTNAHACKSEGSGASSSENSEPITDSQSLKDLTVNVNTVIPRIPESDPSLEELQLEILHLRALLKLVEEEYEPTKERVNRLLVNGKVSFDCLWCIFPDGCEVSFRETVSGRLCAGKVA